MKNYLILEDEPLAAERLQEAVERLRPQWKFLGRVESVREAKKVLPHSNADLLFVDIHLADGNSFGIFEEIKLDVPIIFTTAFDQYALKAFELNSIDYLLKPVNEQELKRAISKLEQRSEAPAFRDWEKLVSELKPGYKKRFLVSTGHKIKSIDQGDVAFFYASGKHSFLTSCEGTEYLFDTPLSKLIDQLDPASFFQINRQFIISINCIDEMISYSKGRLKLVTNPPTPEDAIVSVEKSPRFKAWIAGEL